MEAACHDMVVVVDIIGKDSTDETEVDPVVELVATRTDDIGVEDEPPRTDCEDDDPMVDDVLSVFVDPDSPDV